MNQVFIEGEWPVPYIRCRAVDDQHYKQLILEFLQKFGSAKRLDIEELLLDKLPDVLDESQKKNKVKNLLQTLNKQGFIESKGKRWRISKRR